MLAKDIREMTEADINARLAELERERFNLRLASGTRTLDDPLRLRVIRRDIARLNTVLREKIIGIVEAATSASLPKARSATKTRVSRRTRTGASRSSKRA